jgi:porphobilinogen deaminase
MLSQDGTKRIEAKSRGEDPESVGKEVARELLKLGGDRLLENITL